MELKDSGTRREFETGAVRDICEGKGRCDLLPMDVISHYFTEYSDTGAEKVFSYINSFQLTGDVYWLYKILWEEGPNIFSGGSVAPNLTLELAHHYEDGAKKYGDNNWRKGIPAHCYIDSALRHYLKYLRGDKDEPHDRAFCWNIVACIWTCIHRPEMNEYAPVSDKEE